MRFATLLLVATVATVTLNSCRLPDPTEVSTESLPFEVPPVWTFEQLSAMTPQEGVEPAPNSRAATESDQPAASRGLEQPWWFDFDSPPLHQLVAEGLTQNPTVAQALARVSAALAAVTVEGAPLSPALDFSGGINRQVNQFFLPGAGPQTNRVFTHNLSLGASWELDLWGRIRAGKRASELDAHAQQLQLHGVQLSLSGQIAKGYFGVLESRRQLELALEDSQRADALFERIEQRYQSGLRGALDVRRSASERARAEATLETARRQLALQTRQLEILLGRYPQGELTLLDALPTVDADVPTGLPADLLRRRPDLLQLQLEVWSRGYREVQAEKAKLPRIALTASGGTVSEQLKDVVDLDFGVWSFAANLTQPLLDGGRLQGEVERARANHQERWGAYVSTALRAFSEVEIALQSELYLRRTEQALARTADESRNSLQLSEERYLNGVADLLDVLDARRSYYAAERELLSTRLQRLNNRVDLYLALGGGYNAAPATDAELSIGPDNGSTSSTED